MPIQEKTPSSILRGIYPFEDWPLSGHLKMGEIRQCLISNGLRFHEPEDEDHDHFLAEDLALIECWPFHRGRRLPIDDRRVSIMWRFRTAEDIPDYIKDK